MPKSKEFVESSDSDDAKVKDKHNSDSDGETTKKSATTAKKSKAKSSAHNDDVTRTDRSEKLVLTVVF